MPLLLPFESPLSNADLPTLLRYAREAVAHYVPLRRRYLDLQSGVPDGPWFVSAVYPGLVGADLDYPPLESVAFPTRTELTAPDALGQFLSKLELTHTRLERKTFYPSPRSMTFEKPDGTQPAEMSPAWLRLQSTFQAHVDLSEVGRVLLRVLPLIIGRLPAGDTPALADFYTALPRRNSFLPDGFPTPLSADDRRHVAVEDRRLGAAAEAEALRLQLGRTAKAEPPFAAEPPSLPESPEGFLPIRALLDRYEISTENSCGAARKALQRLRERHPFDGGLSRKAGGGSKKEPSVFFNAADARVRDVLSKYRPTK